MFRTIEQLVSHLMRETQHLMLSMVYGESVTKDVCGIVIKASKLKPGQNLRKILNAGNRSYLVNIYCMPSGKYEYVGYKTE